MAMYTILRHATAAVLPLAARGAAASSSSRAFHRAISVNLLLHKGTTPSRSFSNAVAKEPVADDNIVQVLQTEIEGHAEQVEIPEKFPFEIVVIEDSTDEKTIQLKRPYEDETIQVLTRHLGSQLRRMKGQSWGLIVTVFKGNGVRLEFDVSADSDEVRIHSLSIKKPGESEDQLVYKVKGPKFWDLDENMQKAFVKYLEIRGITPDTFKLLQEYAIKKDKEDDLVLLQNLKSVIEKLI